MYFQKYFDSILVCFFGFVFEVLLFGFFFFVGVFVDLFLIPLFSGTAVIDLHAVIVFHICVFFIIHAMEEIILLHKHLQVLG